MANNGVNSVRLLLVSREPSAHGSLRSLGLANDWHLDTADSGLDVLERIQSKASPHLVLLDLKHGETEMLHTLRWIRKVRPDLPVVLLSQPDDKAQMFEGLRLGARDNMTKPYQKLELEKVLKGHLSGHNSDRPGATGTEDIEPIDNEFFFIAASPRMRKLRARVELLAQVNAPVMILGESGSGKEVAARLIHKLSARSDSRFLKVNCAAIPEDLLESELFGYERGAFTGALRTKEGKLELCNKGTILLDEVAEMPRGLQAKLLHVLQENQFFRLGGKTTVDVDVRILAATNVDVERALTEKKLREDLYYRLSAFSIHIPPLRERKDEIPVLVGHFMTRMAKQYGLPSRNISAAVLQSCQQYAWPGNLRELENFVKRYLVMGEESPMPDETFLAGHVLGAAEDHASAADSANSLRSLVRSAKGEAEKSAIAGALDKTRWNRKAAARLLGVSYRALLYKIQEYEMRPPETYISSSFSVGIGAKSQRTGH